MILEDRPISISYINNCSDNKPTPTVTTWGDFVREINNPSVRGSLSHSQYLQADKGVKDRQKDGPAIIAGTYCKPDTRIQDDMDGLYLVVLDIDVSNLTFEELCTKLEGFECVVHTSFSHSLDKPKYRAFVLLDQPICSDIKSCLERIIDHFDARVGFIDPASRKPGQLYFTPAYPPGGEEFYQFRHLSGVPINPADFPAPPPKEKAKPLPTRLALDHLLFFHVQEAANPGYLRRMEQRTKKQNNQTFWWRPSEALPGRVKSK